MGSSPEKPLEGVLKNIISGVSGKAVATQENVRAAWESAVGKKAAKHSRPRSLAGSRLIVNIDDSSWLYELTVRKKEILKKLGETLKSSRIKDITLRIGDLR